MKQLEQTRGKTNFISSEIYTCTCDRQPRTQYNNLGLARVEAKLVGSEQHIVRF